MKSVRGLYFKNIRKVDKKIKKGSSSIKNLCKNKEKNYLYKDLKD